MPEQLSVGVLDYGSGNLHSVVQALHHAGARVSLGAADQIAEADAVVIPGVGAFDACMSGLLAAGGDELISGRLRAGRAVLGICVGHQVMFSHGLEHEIERPGVGILPGLVEPLRSHRLPHMGWNTVVPDDHPTLRTRLFTHPEDRYYFVHSYAVRELPEGFDGLASWTRHDGDRFVAAVEAGPLTSLQFHPEKSGDAGIALLRRWLAGTDRLGS